MKLIQLQYAYINGEMVIFTKFIEQKVFFSQICSNNYMHWKDFLFPKTCLACGLLGSYICLKCQRKLVDVKYDSCLYCGKRSLFGFTHPQCQGRRRIDGFISIYYYNNTLKRILKNIKYRLVKEAWKELFQIFNYEVLSNKLKYFYEYRNNLVLNPLPLHPSRYNMRGFNQAKLIAQFFSQLLNIPQAELLIRKKNTRAQAQLEKAKDRYLNIKGAFQAEKEIEQIKNVILVDDLVTTGATVKEAAFVLKKAGIKKIYTLTLAKG